MILSPEELQVIRYQKTCFVVLGCCTAFPAGACLALSLLTNCTVHYIVGPFGVVIYLYWTTYAAQTNCTKGINGPQ